MRKTRARRRARTAAACGLAVFTLAAAGCGASHPAASARHNQPRHSPTPVTTQPSTVDIRALAASYLAIAKPANHRLDVEVDGYRDAERGDLAKARADLRAQVVTERDFDRQLLDIRFPPHIAIVARELVRANQRRITLTLRQAGAMSLPGLRALDHRHKAADAAVEVQVKLIRRLLNLPPPATS